MSQRVFSTATVSDAGGREYNEDACDHRDGCWVLADGLGGHGGGEVASRIAVETVMEQLANVGALANSELVRSERASAELASTGLMSPGLISTQLADAILAANRAIQARQQTEPRLDRMRTTLVVLLSDGVEALWAHVGDSRLYHFRDGRIAFQSADHSVPQAMVRAGEIRPAEIRHHEDRNRLLRTLGNADDPRPSLLEQPRAIQAGDAFLLCTDGFWEYVTETEMEIMLAKSADPAAWLHAMTVRLLAQAEPDNDNFSAIAVFVG